MGGAMMDLHDFFTVSTEPTTQFALQVYSHQVEVFARLITYLAVVSVIMWICVVATMLVRLGAGRLYSRQRLRKKL
jgi:hypothetical protein